MKRVPRSGLVAILSLGTTIVAAQVTPAREAPAPWEIYSSISCQVAYRSRGHHSWQGGRELRPFCHPQPHGYDLRFDFEQGEVTELGETFRIRAARHQPTLVGGATRSRLYIESPVDWRAVEFVTVWKSVTVQEIQAYVLTGALDTYALDGGEAVTLLARCAGGVPREDP